MVFELESKVSDAYESAKSGDLDSARSKLDAASEHWLSLDGYTHIFIRHSEIDAITDAFFDFKSDLNDDSSTAYEGSYHRLMAHLESIRTMEQLTFGSIF